MHKKIYLLIAALFGLVGTCESSQPDNSSCVWCQCTEQLPPPGVNTFWAKGYWTDCPSCSQVCLSDSSSSATSVQAECWNASQTQVMNCGSSAKSSQNKGSGHPQPTKENKANVIIK